MNKFQEAIKEVKDSVGVGGVLANPTQTIMTLEKLYEEYRRTKNELCIRCGHYKASHEGSCKGCRWK